MNSRNVIPLLLEEGWLRHQEDAAKPPLKAQTGAWDRYRRRSRRGGGMPTL